MPLAIAAAGVAAAGQIYSGLAANAQGKYEANVAKQNANLQIEAAHQSVLAGQDESRDFWRKVAQTKGQQIASMAANGIDVDVGSAARLQSDTQLLADDDARNMYAHRQEETRGDYINAENYKTEAKAAASRGKQALISSVFGAGSSLLGGFSQAATLKAKVAPSGG